MRRISAPEFLDSEDCPAREIELALQDLGRVTRWFGGVRTTQALVERVTRVTRARHISMLEVAAGSGEAPLTVSRNLARRGITVDLTLLDRAHSHLPREKRSLVGDALVLPFKDDSFDLVSCNLFAHHLEPESLTTFAREAMRVSRIALLINDLVRHPGHLALVYMAFPIMRSRVGWLDGLTSVRGAYTPKEIQKIIASAFPANAAAHIEITRHYLFRMGVIVWKNAAGR